MNLDHATLDAQRRQHPAWRLLAADSAPLVASFLHRVFVAPNVRVMAQPNLAEALEDTLYALREQRGAQAFPKTALEYLNDWAANDKGWLRKFYPHGSDEPHFDLTPPTERALAWLVSLSERSFVGTESRLLTLFALLKQMQEGSETNPQARLAELHKRRDAIDAEIARVQEGELALLDDTALRDRFQQFTALARELLADFREVEHNFRALDRRVRERIALWDGAKGALLQEIMGERDAIADSDQGKSFRAFWDFLMSQSRQEEFTQLLARVLDLPPVAALAPDPRLKRVHYDWLEAGEYAQPPWPSCHSSCAVFWTIRPGWKTAASWTSCTVSRPRPWRCAMARRRCCARPTLPPSTPPMPASTCPLSGRCTSRPSTPR